MKLEEIEKLCEEATPGPWKYDYGNWQVEGPRPRRRAICNLNGLDDVEGNPVNLNIADTEFIAASRELIPKLIAVAKAAEIVCKDHDLRCEDSNSTLCALHDALVTLESE